MNNIIPFPKNYDDFSKIKEWISNVCQKAGLSDLMVENVINEYKEYHSQIIKKYEVQFTLETDIGLTCEQIDKISSAHSEAVQGFIDFHYKQIAHAAHIIIGLLARDQLSGAK